MKFQRLPARFTAGVDGYDTLCLEKIKSQLIFDHTVRKCRPIFGIFTVVRFDTLP